MTEDAVRTEHWRQGDRLYIFPFSPPDPTPAPATIKKGPDPEGNISALLVILLRFLRWEEKREKNLITKMITTPHALLTVCQAPF